MTAPRFLLVCLAMVLTGCPAWQTDDTAPAAPQDAAADAAPVAAPLPPPPPCIHTHCYERPTRLECTFWKVSPQMHAADQCAAWDIKYEGHCDCDMWGVRPATDAGAP